MKDPQPFDSMDAGFAAARKAGKTIRGSVFGVWFRFRINGTAWPISRKAPPAPAYTPSAEDIRRTKEIRDRLSAFYGF